MKIPPTANRKRKSRNPGKPFLRGRGNVIGVDQNLFQVTITGLRVLVLEFSDWFLNNVMDVTPGEFENFPSSARSKRTDTRSSMRSETSGSLEILPPEELKERLFMSEELSEDESDVSEDSPKNGNQGMVEVVKVQEKERSQETGTPSSQQSLEENEDPELQRMIKKMKKYDKILQQKLKKEKEVKVQRLLFQKQMLQELASVENMNEEKLTANANKFLALMPPPERLQELMHELQKEEFVPIFQTQLPPETDSTTQGSTESHEEDETKSVKISSRKAEKAEKTSAKPSLKKKIDFIKRNIELAKDAGNYVSMTDDEKARLSELLADLDDGKEGESSTELGFSSQPQLVGQGYSPDEEEMKRLAEIDEKIQALLPENEFNMICGTPHLSARNLDTMSTLDEKFIVEQESSYSNTTIEDVQKRLESIDEEWKKTFDGTTPRLTNEQLQRLLDECSSRSSVCSSRSLKTLSESRQTNYEFHPSSQSSVSTSRCSFTTDLADDESESSATQSIVQKLPRETLDRLLAEVDAMSPELIGSMAANRVYKQVDRMASAIPQARSSLGLLNCEESDHLDQSQREIHESPLFQHVDHQMMGDFQSSTPATAEIHLEDV